MKYPHIFAPLEIRGVFFKNRILALEPPSRPSIRSGEAGQTLVDSTELLARGGAAALSQHVPARIDDSGGRMPPGWQILHVPDGLRGRD